MSTLYPVDVVQHVLLDIEKKHTVHKTLLKHFQKVLLSRTREDKAIKAFRHFSDMKWKPQDTVPYEILEKMDDVYNLAWLNVHSGQRKLMMGLLEFVLKSLQHLKCKEKDLLIVYAGASGKASSVIAHLFPKIKIVLFDPEENTVNLIPRSFPRDKYKAFKKPNTALFDDVELWKNPDTNMYIFTEEAGWFTDETVKHVREKVLPHSKRKHLVFVSDVRGDTSEKDIVQDMKTQARWTVDLKAKMYMYKFRIPYDTDLYASYADMSYLPQKTQKMTRHKHDPLTDERHIFYLNGKLHLQLFAPPHSIEMRLIGAPDSRGKYVYDNYDAKAIERNMALFNVAYRSHALFEYDGITGNYDDVFQSHIINIYLDHARMERSKHDQVLSEINIMMVGNKEIPFNPRPFVEKKLSQNLHKQYTSKNKPFPEIFRFIFAQKILNFKTPRY